MQSIDRVRARSFLFVASLACAPCLAGALSGDGADAPRTASPPKAESELAPRRELSERLQERWQAGRKVFARVYTQAEGLGAPRFNAQSCSFCHKDPVVGGAGGLQANVFQDDGSPDVGARYLNPTTGEGNRRLQQDLAKLDLEENSRRRAVAVRNSVQTPSLLGLGALDMIYDEEILSREDPDDRNQDGIRGLASRVPMRGETKIGRFGWRAQLPTMKDFVRAACGGELGLTVPDEGTGFGFSLDGDGVFDPEISWKEIDDLVLFCSELAPPARGGKATDPLVQSGESVFGAMGCANCHVPRLFGHDGPVDLYSDLLLHQVVRDVDLSCGGRRMAERSLGSFRTPPLWGVSKTAPYLHDGRARTLSDAIAGHELEGEQAAKTFKKAPRTEQEALLAFLEDL
jgi:CxxC motif-containing protein (DUF1111 family)